MAVRLDKNLRATIDKVVASYNSKLYRYKKKGLSVPERTSYQKIISLGSRKSINRELSRLSSFNIKSNENIIYKGNMISSFEKNNFDTRTALSKKLLKKRIRALGKTEYTIYGNKTGYTMRDRALFLRLNEQLDKGQIRSDKMISNLRKLQRLESTSFDDYLKMDSSERESFMNLLNRIENPYINPKLKESYLESLTDLGYHYGYDPKKLAEIEEKLKQISNEDFEKLFTEDIGIRKILSYYDILKINLGRNNDSIEANREAVIDLYDNIYSNINQIMERYNV